jgi:serine/threonine protein kinase
MNWYSGDLSVLSSDTGTGYDFVRELARQIVTAIRVLHELGIVHGDIKPPNILSVEGDDGSYMLYLCDFGLSFVFPGLLPDKQGTRC